MLRRDYRPSIPDLQELHNWLYNHHAAAAAEALVDEGFTSLRELLTSNLTKDDVKELAGHETLGFNMW